MNCPHTEGPGHDCAYVDQRNALIPLAEERTALLIGDEPRGSVLAGKAWRERWSFTFSSEMDRLVATARIAK